MEKKTKVTKPQKVIRATRLQTALLALIALGTIASTTFSYSTHVALNQILNQDNAQAQPTETITEKYAKGQTMEAALKTGKPIVALFYADWCGYCKRFSPTFAKVTKNGKFKSNLAVAYVDGSAQENMKLMEEYNIEGFPTVYLIHPKKNIKQQVNNGDMFSGDAEKILLQKFLEFAEVNK